MKTRFRLILLIAGLIISGCAAPTPAPIVAPTPQASAVTAAPPLSVMLILARGGLGDKAFNDSAFAGLQKSEKDLGVKISTVEFKDGDAQVANLREAAKGNADLIIALGSENSAPLKTIAAEFPNKKFAILDTSVEAPNVASVTFRELEGDFLAGALMGLLTKTNRVAFLGGADIAVIRRIQSGWQQGVWYANPKAQIVSDFVAGKDDFSGFAKPDVARTMTAKFYQSEIDLVYAAAGGSGLGAIQAAKDAKKLIVTTGSDQRYLAPEVVVTSRTKNMDAAVFTLVSELKAGKFAFGARELDYKSGGIGLAPYEGALVPAEVVTKFKAIVAEMDAGKIKVEAK